MATPEQPARAQKSSPTLPATAGWVLLVAALLAGGYVGGQWLLEGRGERPAQPAPQVMLEQPETIPEEVVVSDREPQPETTPVLIPSEAPQLWCWYRLEGREAREDLRVTWRRGAQDLGELRLEQHRRERGPFPAGKFLIKPPEGAAQFPPGIYQLSFLDGEQVLAETSFVLTPQAAQVLAAQPPPAGETRVVSLATFAHLDPQGQPQTPAQHFGPNDRVHAVFAYINGTRGIALEVHWLSRGVAIPQATSTVPMRQGAGQGYAWLQARGEGLPEGEYEVQVVRAGAEEVLATVRFVVGKGITVPPPPAATETGG